MRTIWKVWRGRSKFKKQSVTQPQTVQSTEAVEELKEVFSDLNQLSAPLENSKINNKSAETR
jgi:hypothetical protein